MKQLHQVQSIKRLRDMISKEEAPQLCEIICKPGRFFIHQITDAPVDKLYDYYNHEGKESLNDPNFRFAVDEVALIAEIFPASLQDLLSEIELFSSKTEPASELDKLSLSARITSSFFRELYMMNQNIDRTKSYSRALAKVTGLRKQCESGNDVQVMTDCQKILKIESN